MQKLWKEYVYNFKQKRRTKYGFYIATDSPKLDENFKISFTVPNKLMQDQFKKGKPKLLQFLREKLNNYGIEIDVF